MRSRFLDDREVCAVRAVLTAREWLPFWIALETGLRIGDVAKLRWRDVSGNAIRYVAQKTGKAGVAVVSDDLKRSLLAERRVNRSEWLFPSSRKVGEHITRQNLWKRLKRACARAGVNPEGFSPHSFRKVYGVKEYHRHGLRAAQAALQHSDISTTELYALADWLSGENADEPIRRSEMGLVLRLICEWLGFSADEPRT